MDLKEIQELVKLLNKSNISEIRIERDNFKIMIRTQDQHGAVQLVRQEPVVIAPAPAVANIPVAPAATPPAIIEAPAATSNLITIKSPMIGTFYRATSPDKPPLVNVGDEIKPGTVLCIVEAMKLFNEIESEYSGRIVKILMENAKPVEYDQPLFLIEPL